MIRPFAHRARRRQPSPTAGAAPSFTATTPSSAHRFADIGVQADAQERFVDPGAYDLLLSTAEPSLDVIELRKTRERVVGVALVDLALEPNRSATGLERGFAPLVDRFASSLHFAPGTHVLRLELSAEPTKDQLEGLARLRDYAQRRRRETGIETEQRIVSPTGPPELRPPKP